MHELKKTKRNDVVHFKTDAGDVHACLVYDTGANGLQIAAPDVGKHWEAIDTRRLSVVIQNGRPIFDGEHS